MNIQHLTPRHDRGNLASWRLGGVTFLDLDLVPQSNLFFSIYSLSDTDDANFKLNQLFAFDPGSIIMIQRIYKARILTRFSVIPEVVSVRGTKTLSLSNCYSVTSLMICLRLQKMNPRKP